MISTIISLLKSSGSTTVTPPPPEGGTIYVSSTGLDTGSGSTEAEAISFERLLTLSQNFTGSEVIELAAGSVFRGKLNLKGGTALARTTIRKYGTGANPVIRGTFPANTYNWVQEGNVWRTSIAFRVGRVFRNGTPERTAQSNDYNVTGGGGTNAITTNATGLGSWVTDAEIVAYEWRWRISHYDINSYNNGVIGLDRVTYCGSNISTTNSFRLFNHPNLITADGDWAWINGILYYRSPGNVNPNTLNVEIGASEEGLSLATNSAYYTVQEIDFFGQAVDGIYGKDISQIEVTDCNFQYQLNAGIALQGESSNVNISGNNFYFPGAFAALCHRVNGYTFEHNHVQGVGMGQDWPYCRDRGTRYNSPMWETAGHAVYFGSVSKNGLVRYNTLDNLAYIGLRAHNAGVGTQTDVAYNKISNFCKRMQDGAGIYTGSAESTFGPIYGWKLDEHLHIYNNLVFGGGPGLAMGIYADNGTQDSEIHNNTVHNCSEWGLQLNFYTRRIKAYRNVIYNCLEQIMIGNDTGAGQFTTSGHQVYDNILICPSPTQKPFRFWSFSGEVFNPFADGGKCENNIMITDTDLVVLDTPQGTNNLAGAQYLYGQPFGQQDLPTGGKFAILDINDSATATKNSDVQAGYREPLNAAATTHILGPFESAAYVQL